MAEAAQSERQLIEQIRNVVEALGGDARTMDLAAREMEAPTVVTVAEAIDKVLGTLRGSTKEKYRQALAKLAARCGDRHIGDVELIELRTWMQDIRNDAATDPRFKHGVGAAESFAMACRCLFGAAEQAGWARRNPATELMPPRRPDSGRTALSESQLSDLFRVASTTGRDPDLDTLMFWFARETACRRSSLLSLTTDRIDRDAGFIRLTEKNDHTRILPISDDLARELFAHRDSRAPGCSQVFHYANGACLTSRRLDSLFARVRRELPWANNLRPSLHWFRHTTLTEIDRLAGHSVARGFAGHSSGDVTDIYTKATIEDLKHVSRVLWGDHVHSDETAERAKVATHLRPRDEPGNASRNDGR